MLLGYRVAHRIGEVDRGRAGLDCELHAARQIVDRRARCVHGAPFDVVDQVARLRHRRADDLEHLLLGLLHLVREVNRRCRYERVNTATFGVPYSFGGARNISGDGAGEPGNHGILAATGDFRDGFEIADRSDRKARLDDVDTHVVERLGNLQLFLERHRRARALLAVAQRRVEDENALFVGGLGGGGHAALPIQRPGQSPRGQTFLCWLDRYPLTACPLSRAPEIRGE